MAQEPSVIGLIAGNGQFPLLFARAARAKGIRVVAVAIKGDTSLLIHLFADQVRWFSAGHLENFIKYFQSHNAKQILMAGQVDPKRLFRQNETFDETSENLLNAIQDRRCDTILNAVGDLLKEHHMELLDSTFLIQDHLAPKGTLTRHAPSLGQLEDIQFGFDLAKSMGDLDIGQTVVVKNRAVIAVEAMEGTDQCILRGGRIVREGAVVVKTSKPNQDSRFDVPVVGPQTIVNMKKVSASCLAIEAGKTIIIDREKTIALADKAGIVLVSA